MGVSENNRRAKFYSLTRAGRKHIKDEAQQWAQTIAIMARFLSPDEGVEGNQMGAVAGHSCLASEGLSAISNRIASSPRRWSFISRCRSRTTCMPE